MKTFTPPTPANRPYATDPETNEQYFRLKPVEHLMVWLFLTILYIAHAVVIGVLAILIYKQKTDNMEKVQKTVYIAGPISNIPGHNVQAFAEATKTVRNMGHIAKNPHEFCHDIPADAPWETFVRRGIQQLMDCTDIVLLPGWEHSDGASLEHMNASIVGITIHDGVGAFIMSEADKTMEVAANG